MNFLYGLYFALPNFAWPGLAAKAIKWKLARTCKEQYLGAYCIGYWDCQQKK